MVHPAITTQSIKDNAPNILQALQYIGSGSEQYLRGIRPHLEKMSSSEGVNCKIDGKPYNIQIGWTRNNLNLISGLFFRVSDNNSLVAYKLLGTSGNEILSVRNNQTEHLNQTELGLMAFASRLLGSVIPKLSTDLTPHNHKVTCNVEHLQSLEKIQAFFEKNKGMLPSTLRNRVYPESHTYLYIGAAILLLVGIAYLAKRYYFDSKPTKA